MFAEAVLPVDVAFERATVPGAAVAAKRLHSLSRGGRKSSGSPAARRSRDYALSAEPRDYPVLCSL